MKQLIGEQRIIGNGSCSIKSFTVCFNLNLIKKPRGKLITIFETDNFKQWKMKIEFI